MSVAQNEEEKNLSLGYKWLVILKYLGISVDKWQRGWNRTTKGKITKDYFPRVAERLNMKISANPKFTTMVTGHGNIKAYLYRFKIAATPTCPCGKKDQTTDHLLYECEILVTKRHFKVISN